MIKNVVFGDTGGHALQLMRSLEKLGVDLELYKMPTDLRVIHVGDVIHKGPESTLLIYVIDQLMMNNPDQWIQIIGNHESQHLRDDDVFNRAPHFWSCDCKKSDKKKLNYWWKNSMAKFAWGIDSFEKDTLKLEISAKPKIPVPDKGILFCHGGVTRVWWDSFLNKETSAIKAAEKINSLPLNHVASPGQLMGVFNPRVGPIWAIGNTEVFGSWWSIEPDKQDDMPFIQIHGHTQSFSFNANKWWPVSPEFRNRTKLNPETRSVTTELSNSLLIGIDPGYSEKADTQEQPFITFESKH
jgi:hypothetical protein